MAREPSYPDDAAVGSDRSAGPTGEAAPRAGELPAATPAPSSARKAETSRRNKHLMTGAAIGIGSAAIVAALLYSRRRD